MGPQSNNFFTLDMVLSVNVYFIVQRHVRDWRWHCTKDHLRGGWDTKLLKTAIASIVWS